jgi:hypothetical protein
LGWQSVLVDWEPDDVVSGVRAALNGQTGPPASLGGPSVRYPPWRFEHANLDGDGEMVVFRVGDSRFGVRYSFAEAPLGPNTGEPCGTSKEWAEEVALDMDEQVLTGGVTMAEHIGGPDGFTGERRSESNTTLMTSALPPSFSSVGFSPSPPIQPVRVESTPTGCDSSGCMIEAQPPARNAVSVSSSIAISEHSARATTV